MKISADHARNIADVNQQKIHEKQYKKLTKNIFKLINRACKEGKHNIRYEFSYTYSNYVKLQICSDLRDMGYRITIYRDCYGCIVSITVDWDLENE